MSENIESISNQQNSEKKKGRWSSVVAMAVALIVDNSEDSIVNSLFPAIRSALNLSMSALGVFASIERFTTVIFGPLWAFAADKFGRKKVLVFITGIWGIWTALAGLAQNYTQLLILYALGTIGTVACEPAAFAILADLFESKERGKAFGAFRAITGFGIVIATLAIGQLTKLESGWRIGLYGMGGLSVLSGILILFFVKEPKIGASESIVLDDEDAYIFKLSEIPILLKNSTYLLLIPSNIMTTSAILFAFAVTFLVDVRGLQNSQATTVYAIAALGFTISSFIGGLIADKAERKYPFKGRIVLMQVFLISYSVISVLATQISYSSVTLSIIIWFIWGLIGSVGYTGVIVPMTTSVTLPEMRSSAFSLHATINGLVTALLLLLAGQVAERIDIRRMMLWFITIPYAINAIYWFIFYKYYRRDVENVQRVLTGRAANLGAE